MIAREPLSKSSAVGALKLNFGDDVRLSACERDLLWTPASRAGIGKVATVYWEGRDSNDVGFIVHT
jgi:hypothetical protein